jgi:phosphoribosylglycinamide formyltransferase-1
VPVLEDDTVDTLTERIKEAERPQLVEYVGRMAREGFAVEGRRVRIGGFGSPAEGR